LIQGHWTKEEDVVLSMAVKAYQANALAKWAKVAQHVPGRTDVQCRERWVNVLDPELKTDPWTPEEDQKLLETVDRVGVGKWSKVSEFLPPRTDNQCWRRWKTMSKEELAHYRQLIFKKKQVR